MSQKPIFVATHPRACSTAFERVFMTCRDTLQTFHEPFGDAFYYGPERMGERFEGDRQAQARADSGFAASTFRTVLDNIERGATEGKRVFIKDMSYYMVPPRQQPAHLAPSLQEHKRGVGTSDESISMSGDADSPISTDNDSGVDVSRESSPCKSPPYPYDTPGETENPTVFPREILEQFHFTFLIRHPRNAIPSFYRCCVPPLLEKTGFQEYLPSEAGFSELRRFFDYCKDTGFVGPQVCGQDSAETSSRPEICIIDADDLLDNPEGILRKYCASIGIDFTTDMLNWNDDDQAFARMQFEKWNGWHDDAINSTDLKPRQHKKVKSDEELYAEWTKKFGKEGADTIKRTVDENVADYEYMKQYTIRA